MSAVDSAGGAREATPPAGERRGEDREYAPPPGTRTEHVLELESRTLRYRAVTDWTVLRRRDDPIAEIFHTAYLLDGEDPASRPLTFVFNGGPGAASAYLHVGAIGPRRVAFDPQGGLLPPPVRLLDNRQSWLAFTDLVFVDPVGTGLSRAVRRDPAARTGAPGGGKGDEPEGELEKLEREFFGLNRDLEALGEFIERFLSAHGRWRSPVFLAGESYGGFRAAKLARKLQEDQGVGMSGAILISPALEWALLTPSDYEILHFSDLMPSLAAAAWYHGRSARFAAETPLERLLEEVEAFASRDLVLTLAQGDAMPDGEREATLARLAEYLGVDASWVQRRRGRISRLAFCRELLRDERKVCGLYDATLTGIDPFPDRDLHEGPDPTLFAVERVFKAAINAQLRETLKLRTDRAYRLLSFDVNRAWKVDTPAHAFERHVGATDDLRYALSLNPHLRVLICHGVYDLVTPYYSSKRIVDHMKLHESHRARIELQTYGGGHMFYTWDTSREAFTLAVRDFARLATERVD